jgi:hypothetical protein
VRARFVRRIACAARLAVMERKVKPLENVCVKQYALIAGGAPPDEFDSEIAAVVWDAPAAG